jgi:hypothetical protein
MVYTVYSICALVKENFYNYYYSHLAGSLSSNSSPECLGGQIATPPQVISINQAIHNASSSFSIGFSGVNEIDPQRGYHLYFANTDQIEHIKFSEFSEFNSLSVGNSLKGTKDSRLVPI